MDKKRDKKLKKKKGFHSEHNEASEQTIQRGYKRSVLKDFPGLGQNGLN